MATGGVDWGGAAPEMMDGRHLLPPVGAWVGGCKLLGRMTAMVAWCSGGAADD